MLEITNRYGNRSGERIGLLTFEGLASTRSDNNRVLGRFLCECGNSVVLPAGRVLNGRKRTHCGCQTDRGAHRTHGMRNTKEYRTWVQIKCRCHVRSNKDYPRYGGKGITVASDWRESFEAFIAHIGHAPSLKHSIDRIDNTRGYEPGNVRWATPTQQQRNRSDSRCWVIRGQEYETLDDAAAAFGVTKQSVRRWVYGAVDSRRETFTQPRSDCRAIYRY